MHISDADPFPAARFIFHVCERESQREWMEPDVISPAADGHACKKSQRTSHSEGYEPM